MGSIRAGLYTLNLNYRIWKSKKIKPTRNKMKTGKLEVPAEIGHPNENDNSTNGNDHENDLQEEKPDQQTDNTCNPNETNGTSEEHFESSKLDTDESTGNSALD